MVFATHWHKSSTGVHVFPSWTPSNLSPHPIPQGHPSAPVLRTLSHASNLDWWSVSHMTIYMFQCHSLRSSHSHLLPQSPKDCSLHLCLFCCLTYRVIIIIYLNSIYMEARVSTCMVEGAWPGAGLLTWPGVLSHPPRRGSSLKPVNKVCYLLQKKKKKKKHFLWPSNTPSCVCTTSSLQLKCFNLYLLLVNTWSSRILKNIFLLSSL